MRLPGSVGQVNAGEYLFDASGLIVSGNTPQLVLPRARSRSSLIIVNNSAHNMYFEFGGPRATASLTSGAVSSVSVTNAGLGYTVAPEVQFLGGAFDNQFQQSPTFSVTSLPEFPLPHGAFKHAKGHCVMTGSSGAMTVSSIVIDDPGAGYLYPPYVFLRNSPNDPFGVANPYQGSVASGVLLLANGGSYTSNGTVCTTDQIAVLGTTTNDPYCCKFTI
jgi:hypothetical protein